MTLMDQLNLDTSKIAQIAVDGQAFSQKTKNAVNMLREEYDKLKADSPQAEEFRKVLGKNLEDLEGTVANKLGNISKVTEELHQDITKLENSDQLVASARAASQVESKKQTKVRLPR